MVILIAIPIMPLLHLYHLNMDVNSTTVSTESFMDCGNDSDFILGNHTCSNNSYTDYYTDLSVSKSFYLNISYMHVLGIKI